MCVVTVVNRNENTKKKYFINDTRANVSAAIQQIVGSFEDLYVEDLIRKDLPGLLALLMHTKMQKNNESPVVTQRKPKIYPDIMKFKG